MVSNSGVTIKPQFTISLASKKTRRRKQQRLRARLRRIDWYYSHCVEKFKYIKSLRPGQRLCGLQQRLVTADPDPYIVRYLRFNPLPESVQDSPANYQFVKACTPVEMAHLRLFDRPVHQPTRTADPHIKKALQIVRKQLKLPYKLQFPSERDILYVAFEDSKYSGLHYALMQMKTRAQADDMANMDATQAFRQLMNGQRVQPHDVRLGGRGEVTPINKDHPDRPNAVGRLFFMISHRDLKLCGITENLLTVAYTPNRYPIAVGLSGFYGTSDSFINRIARGSVWACFDAEKFDSSIQPWMVREAVEIIREQFEDGMNPCYDAYWDFIEESLIQAPIMRDDGARYQKFVGTISGHPHNTLVQSIITLFLGYACISYLKPNISLQELEDFVYMEALGDENVMALTYDDPCVTKKSVSDAMRDMFKVELYNRKSFMTSRLLDNRPGPFQGVHFLGKCWYTLEVTIGARKKQVVISVPYRPVMETCLRLYYPEYGRTDRIDDTYLRALANYLDAAGHPIMEKWLSGLIKWLKPQLKAQPTEWPANFRRLFSRDYSHLDIELCPPKPLTRTEWLKLVMYPTRHHLKLDQGERQPTRREAYLQNHPNYIEQPVIVYEGLEYLDGDWDLRF